jgi:hypothetical protein
MRTYESIEALIAGETRAKVYPGTTSDAKAVEQFREHLSPEDKAKSSLSVVAIEFKKLGHGAPKKSARPAGRTHSSFHGDHLASRPAHYGGDSEDDSFDDGFGEGHYP